MSNASSAPNNPAPAAVAPVPRTPSAPQQSIARQPSVLATPNGSPSVTTAEAASPYAHLTHEQRYAMEDELKTAEIKYGEKMRHAETVVGLDDRARKLKELRNSFGTKGV